MDCVLLLVRVEDVPCFFHDFSSFRVPAVSIIPSALLIWNRFLPATVKVPHRYKRCIFPDRILPYRQSSSKPPRCDLIPRCDLVHIRYTFWNDTAPGLNRYQISFDPEGRPHLRSPLLIYPSLGIGCQKSSRSQICK